MHDAGSLAKVMAVDGAKHGVRGGKGLPDTGLAMSAIQALVKRPRFKTLRTHVCNHAPENTQNRAARCCYATLSRLTSPQRQLSSAYVPYLPISLTIASSCCFGVVWSNPHGFGTNGADLRGISNTNSGFLVNQSFLVQKQKNQLCMQKLTKRRV